MLGLGSAGSSLPPLGGSREPPAGLSCSHWWWCWSWATTKEGWLLCPTSPPPRKEGEFAEEYPEEYTLKDILRAGFTGPLLLFESLFICKEEA